MNTRCISFSILGLAALVGAALLGGEALGQVTLQPKPVSVTTAPIYTPPIVQRSLVLSSGSASTASIYKVPAGKRLKIEQVSGHIEATRGEMLPQLLIQTTAGSVTVRHEIDLGEPHLPLSTPGSHFYYFNSLTAIYAEAGTEVIVVVARGGGGGVDLNQFAISGRLEPMQP